MHLCIVHHLTDLNTAAGIHEICKTRMMDGQGQRSGVNDLVEGRYWNNTKPEPNKPT